MIVTALKTFKHAGKTYRAGDTPNLVSTVARELASTGEVSLSGAPAPVPFVSRGPVARSSALPAVQASGKTISTASDDGEDEATKERKKRRKAEHDES